jgi:hypothetical protein
MMTHRLLTAFVACLALDAFVATVADAQTQPAYNRGSTKVRSRLVNPFNVSSGLSVDRLGVVRYEPRARAAFAPAALTSASTAAAAAAFAPAVATTTAIATSATADLAIGSGTQAESTPQAAGDVIGQGSNVRPPFRPPVRSPFRPPPRPPF